MGIGQVKASMVALSKAKMRRENKCGTHAFRTKMKSSSDLHQL
jgi:hypothetical protein